jgi:uncharacterized protein
MTTIFSLLTLQALLGGIDNLWHHEITERLPARRGAAGELSLHAVREMIYALIFAGLALYQPHGAWAWLLAALLATEIVVTLADFIVEDRTRHLPPFERVLHTLLAVLFGAFLAALAPVLLGWTEHPTALLYTRHAFTVPFLIFAAGLVAWSLRNAIAVLRLTRPPEWVRNPVEAGHSERPRTVLVTGATGFIGGHVVRKLVARGDQVIVLTRRPELALARFGPLVRVISRLDELDGAARIHAIVNLAGARILGMPWTRTRRRVLIASRVETTRAVVALMGRLKQPVPVLVSASAIGFYGTHGEDMLDEDSPAAEEFQSQLCQRWEEAALAAQCTGARVVRLRIGMVLGRDGGALPQLLLPARLGLAAVLGAGRHWMSWIHIDDLVRLIEFAIDTPRAAGVLNAVAPRPATQRQFQRVLTKTLRRPLWLRVPAGLVRTALGDMATLLVDGQRVIPVRAMSLGFRFRYRRIDEALLDLCGTPAPAGREAQVYFNGACRVCSAEMSRYRKDCDTAQLDLRFVDAAARPQDLARCGLRPEHLQRRVYLREADGRITSGFPALLTLWRTMPGYGGLARVLGLPMIRPVCEILYDQAVAPALAWWAQPPVRAHSNLAHNRTRRSDGSDSG